MSIKNRLKRSQTKARAESPAAVRAAIKIHPQLSEFIPPMAEEQFGLLEDSIRREGVRDAILLWKEEKEGEEPSYWILDGHNRYNIAQRHQLDYKFTIAENVVSLEDAQLYMLQIQLGRRNLNDAQQRYFLGLEYQYMLEKAKRTDRKQTAGRTREVLAKDRNINPQQVYRAAKYAAAVDAIGQESPQAKADILAGVVKPRLGDMEELAAEAAEKRLTARRIKEVLTRQKPLPQPAAAPAEIPAAAAVPVPMPAPPAEPSEVTVVPEAKPEPEQQQEQEDQLRKEPQPFAITQDVYPKDLPQQQKRTSWLLEAVQAVGYNFDWQLTKYGEDVRIDEEGYYRIDLKRANHPSGWIVICLVNESEGIQRHRYRADCVTIGSSRTNLGFWVDSLPQLAKKVEETLAQQYRVWQQVLGDLV